MSARDPDALRRYVVERHVEQERLVLRELGVDLDAGLAQIEYVMTRRAADLAGGAPLRVEGKGAVDCEAGSIAVMSMSVVSRREATRATVPAPTASARPAADRLREAVNALYRLGRQH